MGARQAAVHPLYPELTTATLVRLGSLGSGGQPENTIHTQARPRPA